MAIPMPRTRRTLDRHRVHEGIAAEATFPWPARNGRPVVARLRDVSYAGISLVLRESLPGLEVGECLKGVSVSLDGVHFGGELLVMHLTPAPQGGVLCGGLFYPVRDADVLALRKSVRRLEAGG
jgi:hypothetical protein